jgi:hypothetical protein
MAVRRIAINVVNLHPSPFTKQLIQFTDLFTLVDIMYDWAVGCSEWREAAGTLIH